MITLGQVESRKTQRALLFFSLPLILTMSSSPTPSSSSLFMSEAPSTAPSTPPPDEAEDVDVSVFSCGAAFVDAHI